MRVLGLLVETLIQGLSGKFFLYLFDFISLIVKLAHPMEVVMPGDRVILEGKKRTRGHYYLAGSPVRDGASEARGSPVRGGTQGGGSSTTHEMEDLGGREAMSQSEVPITIGDSPE